MIVSPRAKVVYDIQLSMKNGTEDEMHQIVECFLMKKNPQTGEWRKIPYWIYDEDYGPNNPKYNNGQGGTPDV